MKLATDSIHFVSERFLSLKRPQRALSWDSLTRIREAAARFASALLLCELLSIASNASKMADFRRSSIQLDKV